MQLGAGRMEIVQLSLHASMVAVRIHVRIIILVGLLPSVIQQIKVLYARVLKALLVIPIESVSQQGALKIQSAQAINNA